ncbi:MAG TPA: squalene--hopene cyclase [Nevskiaceae bacterium]
MSDSTPAMEARERSRAPNAGRTKAAASGSRALDRAIARGRAALLALQKDDGHWCFELEADCTIPAEYILMMHFMDEIDVDLEKRIARFLRAKQVLDGHGGWPLYHGGALDVSCTVKCYYALKLVGDNADAPHMRRARDAVLALGGAARSNVFTKIMLAQFRQIPWHGIPFMPAEIMLLPKWFPFHLDKVSYWSRTVMVPLFILMSRRTEAKNPRGIGIRELFTVDPSEERGYLPARGTLSRIFLAADKMGRAVEPFVARVLRERSIRRAEQWLLPRLNGEDGLGGIFPAMVNAYEALAELGYPPDHPARVTCRKALQKLLVQRPDGSVYCQPCVSPIWDTGWAALALLRSGPRGNTDAVAQKAVDRALEWLAPLQETELKGDWAIHAPKVPPGGWAFQYRNAYYPDLDDTAMVAAVFHVAAADRYPDRVQRAADWLVGMQSSNGAFGAFDVDNDYLYLNKIPFADHGALCDPPTEDVSGRALIIFGLLGRPGDREAVRRCIEYLKASQQPDGSWWGRWGTNYIYGTWSVLSGLAYTDEDMQQPWIRRAVDWLCSKQNADGGWGEGNDSYADPRLAGELDGNSTGYATAWAVLGLMAAGCVRSPAVERGIAWLVAHQDGDGIWQDETFTAPGFPRVFYLKYHGYSVYFPLWALVRYRRLTARSTASGGRGRG